MSMCLEKAAKYNKRVAKIYLHIVKRFFYVQMSKVAFYQYNLIAVIDNVPLESQRLLYYDSAYLRISIT
jgi:hypothetical protein